MKKNKMKIGQLAILVIIVSLFTSCKRLVDKSDPRRLQLTNNSNRNIIFFQSHGISDINDPNVGSPSYSDESEPVKKNSTEEYALNGWRWESYLEGFPNGRVIVFVLDYDSVVKYANPHPTYGSDSNQILKKQFVNMDTLIKNNWTLVYP